MAQVVLKVNGHSYTMQCGDGEEEHLRDLGQLLDSEVENIKAGVGQVGDIRLLLMAGLVVADRLSETVQRVEDLEDQISGLRQARTQAAKQDEKISENISSRIEAAADRVESLAREMVK